MGLIFHNKPESYNQGNWLLQIHGTLNLLSKKGRMTAVSTAAKAANEQVLKDGAITVSLDFMTASVSNIFIFHWFNKNEDFRFLQKTRSYNIVGLF